jgi:hypothetical protein
MVVEALNRGTDPERIAQAVRTMTRRYRAPRVADFSDDILRRLEDGFHMPEGILGTTLVAGSRPGTGGRGLDPARGGTRTGTRRESRASRREREQREYTQQRERQRQLERERQRQLEQSPVVETRVPGRESTRKLDWTKEELQDLLGKAHRQANRMTESRIDWANLSSEEAHEEDRKRTAAGFIASIIERGSGYYHGDYVTSIDVDDDGNPAAAAMIRVKEAGRPITTAEVPLIGSIKVGRGLRVMRDVAKRAKESGVKFLKGYALADASKIYSKLGAKYTQDFMNERYPKGGASGGMTLDLRGMAFDMALDELTEDDFPIGAWGHKNW